jgi:hypothetical protein
MIFSRGELASESLKAELVEPRTSVAADRRSAKETMELGRRKGTGRGR